MGGILKINKNIFYKCFSKAKSLYKTHYPFHGIVRLKFVDKDTFNKYIKKADLYNEIKSLNIPLPVYMVSDFISFSIFRYKFSFATIIICEELANKFLDKTQYEKQIIHNFIHEFVHIFYMDLPPAKKTAVHPLDEEVICEKIADEICGLLKR